MLGGGLREHGGAEAGGFTVLRSSDGGGEDSERRPWLHGGDVAVATRVWRSDAGGCAAMKEPWRATFAAWSSGGRGCAAVDKR
jgi:hypothetical protein